MLKALQVEKDRPPDAHMYLLHARRLAACGGPIIFVGVLTAGWYGLRLSAADAAQKAAVPLQPGWSPQVTPLLCVP